MIHTVIDSQIAYVCQVCETDQMVEFYTILTFLIAMI